MSSKANGKIYLDKNLNSKSRTRYEKLGIPWRININKFTYIYKGKSKANNEAFFYRCHKNNCKII